MQFGVNPLYFTRRRPGEAPLPITEAIEMVMRHGFTALDLPCRLDEPQTQALAQYLSDHNLHAHMSHLPFWRYQKSPDYEQLAKNTLACAKAAHLLGAEVLVAHADEFDFDVEECTAENILEFNYRFFAPVVEYAAAHDMKVAFENVFEDMGKPRNGSSVYELFALLDRFGTDHVGICWDFGHAKVQSDKTKKLQRPDYLQSLDMAADHILCTHLHDNYYGIDMHALPFLGDTDWESTMRILEAHHYSNPLSLELVYGTIPRPLLEDYTEILHKSMLHLADMREAVSHGRI